MRISSLIPKIIDVSLLKRYFELKWNPPMRYRYTFDVKSYTHLARTLYFIHRDLKFRLVETGGRFTKLIVETRSVTLPTEAMPTPNHEEPLLAVPPDLFVNVVVEEVRAIRGALALWGVIDVDVDRVLREFVPETIEENGAITVKSIQYKRWDREKLPLVPTTSDLFIRCIVSRKSLARYEVPLEFYRRGADDRFHEQYVEAIFNFFFVLEYLFGEGQFRSVDLIGNFLASPKLLAGLTEARSQFLEHSQSEDVTKKFREKYCNPKNEEVVQTIVDLRGRLHHQTIKRINWHPALQKEFEMDADFLGAVCHSVLMAAVLEVLFEENEKKQFLATAVFDANGNPIQAVNPEQLDA
jgi:hypothetical protein